MGEYYLRETELSQYLRAYGCELHPSFTGCLYNGMGMVRGSGTAGPPAPQGWDVSFHFGALGSQLLMYVSRQDTIETFGALLFELQQNPNRARLIRPFAQQFPIYRQALRSKKLKRILYET